MKLAQLAVLNWGQIESRDYPLADMTLLTGETGAGKSTLLDAVQAVMTAAKHGLYAFNPGQQATAQGKRDGKSKRSLAAYAVGEDGKGNYLRAQGAHSYLAAAFVPDAGEEAAPFTAVLALAARVEGQGALRQAKEEHPPRFFIVEGHSLSCADFVLKADLSEVVAADKAHNHLRSRYGSTAVVKYDDKGSYLSRLYGLFTGRAHAADTEVNAAAKAFSRSIAYREIGSVDELVKTEMLTERDFSQEIAQIMAIIRDVDRLAREAKRLQASIARLEDLQTQEQALRAAYLEQAQVSVLEAAKRHADALAACERHRENGNKAAAQLGVLETAQEALKAEAALIGKRRERLIQRQSQNAAWQQASTLETEKKAAQQNYQNALTSLVGGIKVLESWQQRIKQWSVITPLLPPTLSGQFLPLLRAATPLAALACGDLQAEAQGFSSSLIPDADKLNRWLLTLQAHEKKLVLLQSLLQPEHGESLQSQMLTAALSAEAAATTLVQEATALRGELGDAEKGMDYPANVRAALPHLRLKFADADVTVLADLIEPKEGSRWMKAIEGLMGQERYVLLVKPVWEAPIIDWLKDRLGREAPTVAQAGKALKDSENRRQPANSIVEELTVTHPLAAAFVNVRFGSTIKIFDTVTLTKTAQGLMDNGLSARSYQMRNVALTDAGLIFGLAARKARAEARKSRIKELDALITEKQQAAKSYRALAKLLLPEALPAISDAANVARSSLKAWAEAERQLGLLDRSDLAELEREERDIRAANKANEDDLGINNKEIGKFEKECEDAARDLLAAEETLPSFSLASEQRQRDYINYCKPDAALDTHAQLKTLLEEAPQLTIQALTHRRDSSRDRASDALSSVKTGLMDYNREAPKHEQIESAALRWPASGSEPNALFHAGLLELAALLREQFRKQKLIGLAERTDELDKARKNFGTAFSAHFCYRIKSAVDEGVKTLQRLNVELKKLRFGNDVFECDWDWLQQGKQRYDYFDYLHLQGDAVGEQDLFAAELPEHLAKVRDELKALLLTDDPEKARAELKRIADYREYRRYEVFAVARDGQKVALSKWGSGSGGELETPAYVVRAAICAEAFRLFHGSGPRLRLMMFDEAFSKIDAKRSKGLLSFLNEHLGMQILCAMPTRGAGALLPAFQRQYSFAAVTHTGDDGRELPQSLVQMKDFRSSALTALWEQRLAEVRDAAKLRFEQQQPEQLSLTQSNES